MAESVKEENCGSCRFCIPMHSMIVGQDTGSCQRNPPQLVLTPGPMGQVNMTGAFPPVKFSNWCGEFKSRVKEKKGGTNLEQNG